MDGVLKYRLYFTGLTGFKKLRDDFVVCMVANILSDLFRFKMTKPSLEAIYIVFGYKNIEIENFATSPPGHGMPLTKKRVKKSIFKFRPFCDVGECCFS